MHLNRHNDQRRKCAPHLSRHQHKAKGQSPFAHREPAGDDHRDIRVAASFTDTKEESDNQKNGQTEDGTGECGKSAPPQNMRVSTRRGPIRSPRVPEGISNRAKARANIPFTHPHPTGPICRASCIRGPATEMQTRSSIMIVSNMHERASTRWRYFND